jgi:hypothetical protein
MSSDRRLAAARQRALDDAKALVLSAPDGKVRFVSAAIGDPQAPLDTFLEILETHGLLGDDGRLLPEAGLVSMGDHFDWGKVDQREQATLEGTAILSWLAAHPPDQVQIVFGNHDLVRVGELAGFGDDDFRQARAEADAAYQLGAVDPAREAALLLKYPQLPKAEVLARDFSCFDVAQRTLVTKLLKARRARLAVAPAADLLLVHAGLTQSELSWLGVPDSDAFTTAAALNRFLDDRVDRWDAQSPLDLSPMHEAGSAKTGEARGILFHRPANPALKSVTRAERRFDPRTLPRSISQAIGHISDKKCRELLGDWAEPGSFVYGRLRGLRLEGETVRYRLGCDEHDALFFLDGGMSHVPPSDYELFDLRLRQKLAGRALAK